MRRSDWVATAVFVLVVLAIVFGMQYAIADYYWTCGATVELRDGSTSVPASDQSCQPAVKGNTRTVTVYDQAGNQTATWVEAWNGAAWVKQ